MEKTKKKQNCLISLMLALLILVTGFAGMFASMLPTAQAHAFPYDEDDYYKKSIYYFTDYYTTLDTDVFRNGLGAYDDPYDYEVQNYWSEYKFYLDHQYVDSQEFDYMVYNDYFRGIHYMDNNDDFFEDQGFYPEFVVDFTGGDCVVIDIKTFKPNSDTLYELFHYLKVRNCKTVFVSPYSEAEFYEEGYYYYGNFFDYVDLFVQDSDMLKLKLFVVYLLFDFFGDEIDYLGDKTRFLLDGNIIGLEHYIGEYLDNINFDYWYREMKLTDSVPEEDLPDMNTLCEHSPFLRMFLTELCYVYGMNEVQDDEDYNAIADWLRENRFRDDDTGVEFLVHVRDNIFVDILTWKIVLVYEEYGEIYFDGARQRAEYMVAIGFWYLERDFYDILWNIMYDVHESWDSSEVTVELVWDFPIYILEVDLIEEGPFPLHCIVLNDLLAMYNAEHELEDNTAANELLNGLISLLSPQYEI